MGQPARVEKMISVQGRGRFTQKGQASKVSTGLSFNRSNDGDYEDPLGSNIPEPFKALAGPDTLAGPETTAGSPQALLPTSQDPGANQYSQQDLDRIILTFFHTSKYRFSGN